jgi:hypothetical protein
VPYETSLLMLTDFQVQRDARDLGPCEARNIAKTREDVRSTVLC